MKDFLTPFLNSVFAYFALYLGQGMGGSVLTLFFFLFVCFVLFSIFPQQRKIILFIFGFFLAKQVLGVNVLLCIFSYVLLWFFCLTKMDTLSKTKQNLLLRLILFLSFSLYFILMNARHFGLTLPKSNVQSLGLSYLIWRVLHVSVDWKRGKIANKDIFSFLLYIFYFPTLMGGPIERIQRFYSFPFFTQSTWKINWNLQFLFRILFGFFKIILSVVFLGNDFSYYWDHALSINHYMLLKVFYLNAITFYLIVSAANDINISISSLMQIPLCENYNNPYFQKNLSSFWRNWHISLSSILNEYIYEPLGGKRKNQYLNYIFTFFICAMWHDSTWAFVIWGFAHGFALCVLRIWQQLCNTYFKTPKKFLSKYPKTLYALSVVFTFHFVAWAWLPFQGGHPQGSILMFRVLGLEKAALWVAKLANYYPY